MNKHHLRQTIRRQRRELCGDAYKHASEAICQRLSIHPWLRSANHVAIYLPNDGEPDVSLLPDLSPFRLKHFYLPCLDNLGRPHMVFRHWQPGDSLKPNRFGIPEPLPGKIFPTWALSLVIVPLVAFDKYGNRLGMGAGYYDRTLIFKRNKKVGLPKLIGVAHDFQEVDPFEPAPWDIPLDLIITDQRTIKPE
jgi:5-formyltetrahydrofolate cyclo-ligase